MAPNPKDLPIALMVAAGFVEEQFTTVQKRLMAADTPLQVLSPDGGLVQGWHDGAWGHHFMADDKLADVLSADFRALIVPDGDRATAALVSNPHGARLVKAFMDAGKPVCFVGSAVQLLASAEAIAGRRVAAGAGDAEALQTAGAVLVEETVVTDGALITAAGDADFNDVLGQMVALVEAAGESVDEAA